MTLCNRRNALQSLFALLLAAGLQRAASGGEGCCDHCGCNSMPCGKVCRLVQEDRKITTTCWGISCEGFCVSSPSTPESKHCETAGKSVPGNNDVASHPKKLVWTSWCPGCGPDLFTKRKLMKRTVTKTVPSFKWVVEDLCQDCQACVEPVTVPKDVSVPPVPQVGGPLVSQGSARR